MKKLFIPVSIIALVSAVVCGCRPHAGDSRAQFAIDSAVINQTVKLVPEDSISPACNLRISLAYLTGDDAVEKLINDTIVRAAFEYEHLAPKVAADSFATHYLRDYHAELISFYQEDKKQGDVSADGTYNYEYILEGTVSPATPDSVWGYQIESYVYEGGAHGYNAVSYFNFSRNSGKRLQLNDVFKPEYEKPLTQLLLDALMKKLDVHSMEELKGEGYLDWTDMYPSANFLMGKDSIKFRYNAYEIAPYACGSTELTIPYTALKDLLKP